MPIQQPPSESVLARAAELRAAGNGWEAVASQMRRSVHTIRKWPQLYPDRWAAALHAAECRLVAEAGAESVLVLRQLLRSGDEKVRRDAAKHLIYLRLEQIRAERNAGEEPATRSDSPDSQFAAFLEAHSDEDLARLAARLRDTPLPSFGGSLPPDRGSAD